MIGGSLEIVVSSFKMAVQELWKNKLRTFLSLFGITIGIFCIISVLATVNSLEQNIQNEIKSLGNNTIYLDKWVYNGGPDYPWWKYVNRPVPKYSEVHEIKARSSAAKFVAFRNGTNDQVKFLDNTLTGVSIHSINEDFSKIQDIEVNKGRFFTDGEFSNGANVCVIGDEVANKLFGDPERALDKMVVLKGKSLQVVGIIKKQGKNSFLGDGGWQFDNSLVVPYYFGRTILNELTADPLIMIQGPPGMSSKGLKDDLLGTMRAIRKLSPTQEDNFALNDINDFSDVVSGIFSNINMGGWAIAILSLIVGMFGVANIMFVSVRERTNQIGLKKAIGAKKSIILTEFLLESSFLSIIGGAIGLALVFLLTTIATAIAHFPFFISLNNMLLAIGICIAVGILAGFIPARQAANMDPVVAIRSK